MTEGAWLQDPDVTLYHGDVLAVLPELPASSVDCVVTSPPYWGLRDYGTGAWEGGDAECDHKRKNARNDPDRDTRHTDGRNPETQGLVGVQDAIQYSEVCGKCGATRIDQQLGLEPTPEQYVERMVEVFRALRRVLAPHGTVWLNLGDSYAGAGYSNHENTGGAQREDGGKPRHLLGGGLKSKDLVGIPWRVAFALQADGWYLRSDIIWAKPNPMPESVTDRPTKAHEYVFLLSKQPRYFFDQEAVREASFDTGTRNTEGWKTSQDAHLPNGHPPHRGFKNRDFSGGRNVRSVWEVPQVWLLSEGVTERTATSGRSSPSESNHSVWPIATQPYPEAHFATFPEELARRCIAAGCPEQVCRVCGKARERVVERETPPDYGDRGKAADLRETGMAHHRSGYGPSGNGLGVLPVQTLGWTECDCGESRADSVGSRDVDGSRLAPRDNYRPGIVLDPFMGSGTVAHVARKLGRHAVGIDLSAEYLALAARRLQQQSLFAEAT